MEKRKRPGFILPKSERDGTYHAHGSVMEIFWLEWFLGLIVFFKRWSSSNLKAFVDLMFQPSETSTSRISRAIGTASVLCDLRLHRMWKVPRLYAMLLWQQCNCNFEEQHILCVPASALSWWWNYVWLLSFWLSCWQTVGASLQEFRIMSWHHWCLNVQSKCVCVCVYMPASKQHLQLHRRWWFGFPWRRIVRFLLKHPWTHRSFTEVWCCCLACPYWHLPQLPWSAWEFTSKQCALHRPFGQ